MALEELNTSMEASATSWLSDMEMRDYNLFTECHLSLLDDEEFLSPDIASVLQGEENLQQTLSSESYSSYPTCTSQTLSNSSIDETSFERPTKLLKTNTNSISWTSSSIKENFSPKPSPSSQILTFDNSSMSSPANTTLHFYGFDRNLNPKHNDVGSMPESQLGNMNVSAQSLKSENEKIETKIPNQGTKRSPALAQDHILAERKRREKLSQSFIALAALIPGLKKMDKASVLADAIKYVKELKERLRLLEEQIKKSAVESVVVVDDASSCDENFDATEALPHVEARVSDMEVLLRIHCHKRKGVLVKILSEIQNLHLFVVNSSVLPFGDSILDITIVAQLGAGYNLTVKDLVRNLRVATLKLMS